MSGFSESQSGKGSFFRKFFPSRFINSSEEVAEDQGTRLVSTYLVVSEVRIFRTLLDLEQQTSLVQLCLNEFDPEQSEYQSLGKDSRAITLQIRVEQKELPWITGLAKRSLKLLDYQSIAELEAKDLELLAQSQSEEIVELREEIEHLESTLTLLATRPNSNSTSSISFEVREIAP